MQYVSKLRGLGMLKKRIQKIRKHIQKTYLTTKFAKKDTKLPKKWDKVPPKKDKSHKRCLKCLPPASKDSPRLASASVCRSVWSHSQFFTSTRWASSANRYRSYFWADFTKESLGCWSQAMGTSFANVILNEWMQKLRGLLRVMCRGIKPRSH